MRRRVTSVAIGLGAILAFVALPDRAQAAPAPTRVTLTMTERACKVSRRQLKVGAAMFTIVNRSRRAVLATTHRVDGRATTGDVWAPLHEFNGVTNDNGVLEHIPGSPWTNVRYVRVNTTASVSWVSWREIEIFAP